MKTYNNEPNFSIVLPGPCNANCSFCFWKEEKAIENYIEELKKTLAYLPSSFKQVSLTGGEPTLSPYFAQVLKLVVKRFSKVVLTTNGCNLEENIKVIKNALAKSSIAFHVNISRHHHEDGKNMEMFGTDTIPCSDSIESMITELNMIGVDVNANCVLTDEYNSIDKIKEFIKFAKEIGFTSVAFRKQHGDLEPSEQEEMFKDYYPIHVGKCPVCYSKEQLIMGIRVMWKSSISEPKDTITDSVYELVYQQNSKLTFDWAGKEEIVVMGNKLYTPSQIVTMAKQGLLTVPGKDHEDGSSSISSGGCGRSGGGC